MSYLDERRHMKQFGKPPKEKTFSAINKKSEKKIAEEKAAKESGTDEAMDRWFDFVISIIKENPYCWECGEIILPEYFRDAAAHILPKKKEYGFPSVATHEENFLILGAGCGCHNKTHRWDTFQKMKVWPLAVERFKIIYPFIATKERKNLPQVLLQAIEIF